jgi:hypothetical protein
MNDFDQLVGKTLNRSYLSTNFHSLILRFTDESWFNMSKPLASSEAIIFIHITGTAALLESVITAVDVIDSYNVSFTTSKGVVSFSTQLVQPNYIDGVLDVYSITDVESYDDNDAVRLIAIGAAPNWEEVRYKHLTFDF